MSKNLGSQVVLESTDFVYEGKKFRFSHSNSDDFIFKTIKTSGLFYEIGLLEVIKLLISPGDLVIDVGANIGNHSVFFAGACECKVLAVEPNPAAIDLLHTNIEDNGLAHLVEVEEVATGAATATGTMVEQIFNNMGANKVVLEDGGPLTVKALDDLIDPEAHPRLIKADVEGMEFDTLKGATELIKRTQPILILEIATSEEFTAIAALLSDLGYRAAASFNYTPTHIFVPNADRLTWNVIEQNQGYWASLRYIDIMRGQSALQRNSGQVREQISALRDDLPTQSWIGGELTGAQQKLDTLQTILSELGDKLNGVAYGVEAIDGLESALNSQFGSVSERVEAIGGQVSPLGSQLSEVNARLEAHSARLESVEAQVASVNTAIDTLSAKLQDQVTRTLQAVLLVGETTEIQKKELALEVSQILPRRISAQISTELAGEFKTLTDQLTDALGEALAKHEFQHGIWSQAQGQDLKSAMKTLKLPSDSDVASTDNVWAVRQVSDSVMTAENELPASVLFEESFADSWEGKGWPQGPAQLQDHGLISVSQSADRAGAVGRYFEAAGGGLVEIEIESKLEQGSARRCFGRIMSSADKQIGRDFELQDGVSRYRVYASAAAEKLRVFILLDNVQPATVLRVGNVRVQRLSAKAHQKEIAASVNGPVIASLASIPKRVALLEDCVGSLLVQCDKVRVFLNNYEEVPAFLDHPRVEVKQSQDWDDRGDAGKFFWVDKEENDNGYRLTVDDDLIFPPDFVKVMTSKVAAAGDRAIYSTHAVLLRQPFQRYYERAARAETFHFEHSADLDRGAHIGATGALCYSPKVLKMRWEDFRYRNSADVWLSQYAQQNSIPVLTPARVARWVVENDHHGSVETIYNHAHKRTKTLFDSSLVQDAALKHFGKLTIQPLNRSKLGLVIEADDDENWLQTIDNWLSLRSNEIEWVVMLIANLNDDQMRETIDGIHIPNETHIIDASTGDPRKEVGRLLDDLQIEALAYLTKGAKLDLFDQETGSRPSSHLPERQTDTAGRSWNLPDGSKTVAAIGGKNAAALDVLSKALHELQLVGTGLNFSAIDMDAILQITTPPKPARNTATSRLNDVFERVQVLNLDRRPDRWKKVTEQMGKAGVIGERFSAVDGADPTVAAEFEAYRNLPLIQTSDAVPDIKYSADLYMNYLSQNARIAHLEAKSGSKAIASPGAWGYMRSYEAILESALSDQVETLMVFDDDAMFHDNFTELFEQAMTQLPDDWLIVQLGSLQYDWSEEWLSWYSSMLYRTHGVAVGSHAVGMKFEIIPFLLDQVKRMDMPFDVGALSAAVKAFRDRCYVISPNLVIQSLAESDIATSDFQKTKSVNDIAATYRWNLDEYS